jgi:hypothetical protein
VITHEHWRVAVGEGGRGGVVWRAGRWDPVGRQGGVAAADLAGRVLLCVCVRERERVGA